MIYQVRCHRTSERGLTLLWKSPGMLNPSNACLAGYDGGSEDFYRVTQEIGAEDLQKAFDEGLEAAKLEGVQAVSDQEFMDLVSQYFTESLENPGSLLDYLENK